MIFDEELQKGVKKRFISAPVTMSLPCNVTYDTLIEKGREHFFPDETGSDETFFLDDSSGIPYKIEDKSDWTLSDFIQNIGQPPSKLRLYTLCHPKVNTICTLVHCESAICWIRTNSCTLNHWNLNFFLQNEYSEEEKGNDEHTCADKEDKQMHSIHSPPPLIHAAEKPAGSI